MNKIVYPLGVIGLAAVLAPFVLADLFFMSLALGVLCLLLAAIAFRAHQAETQVLSSMESVLQDASVGKLEGRILMIPAGQRLSKSANGVNNVLDQTEAVLREALTVVTRMGQGALDVLGIGDAGKRNVALAVFGVVGADVLCLPEAFLVEIVALFDFCGPQHEGDHRCPDPDRGEQQAAHDDLDDKIG